MATNLCHLVFKLLTHHHLGLWRFMIAPFVTQQKSYSFLTIVVTTICDNLRPKRLISISFFPYTWTFSQFISIVKTIFPTIQQQFVPTMEVSFKDRRVLPALKKQRTATTSQLSISHDGNPVSKKISFIPENQMTLICIESQTHTTYSYCKKCCQIESLNVYSWYMYM